MFAPNCLKDFVGVRGYHVAPESGWFINQLQGVSLKAIQYTADSEQVTFLAVWDDVQARAWVRLSTDFRTLMRSKYCLGSDAETDAIICGDKSLFTRAWLYALGIELIQERLQSERINKLTTIDREKGKELEATFTEIYESALVELMPAIKYKEQSEQLARSYARVERIP